MESRVDRLIESMPPVCGAYNLPAVAAQPRPGVLLDHFLGVMVDVTVRNWTRLNVNGDSSTPALSWINSLLSDERQLTLSPQPVHRLYRDWRTWTEQLHVPGDTNFRICFMLSEPDVESDDPVASDLQDSWTLHYFLQARDNPALLVSAGDVWRTRDSALRIGDRRLDQPQERLLAGLGVASRFCKPIELSLSGPQPETANLTTAEAHRFLRDTGPLLESCGFGLLLPKWWHGSRRLRLGLRLRLLGADASDDRDPMAGLHDGSGQPIRYTWELTLGGETVDDAEFEQLAAMGTPLVRLRKRWVELDPDQMRDAERYLKVRSTGGTMSFLQALRLAQSYVQRQEEMGQEGQDVASAEALLRPEETGLPNDFPTQLPLEAVGIEGWLAQVLARLRAQELPKEVAEPTGFSGTLRPYQRRGVGWLKYLRDLRLGACLADDMGLGKTVQAIALLLQVKADARRHNGATPDALPALLICPTSVVANWKHEIERFAPGLRPLVHHGVNRLDDMAFLEAMRHHDLAITSFGTARRDIDLLTCVEWGELILDEAQNIKNPRAKQTQAVRRIQARNRIALTGTPVENQLAELWSIMEFLNPGYLGGFERFRKRFIVPIERYNDDERAGELRSLVQPLLLRRLKSDPTIISDLPEKNEMVVYCSLTKEQADLYQETVQAALDKLALSQGTQRRGLVLGLLTKLKQISNHPAHFLREQAPLPGRSGKFDRLTEMLDEALSVGDRALIFTQFVEMGHLLQRHLRTTLDSEALFLHGGTQARQRDRMVQLFPA